MTSITRHLWAVLMGAVLLSSCSRPVAYFQRGTAEPLLASTSQTEAFAVLPPSAPAPPEPATQPDKTEPYQTIYVRKDNQVVGTNRVGEHMKRMKRLGELTQMLHRSEQNSTYHSMNRIERLTLKVMNRKISRQLAPRHPEKSMINSPVRAIGGGILLIGGLLLLILGSGTVAFIGLILSLVGAVGVVVGLVGI